MTSEHFEHVTLVHKTSLKGTVHPKMKFCHYYSPSSSSKPAWMSLFYRIQRKIFWRKFVIRLFWGTTDFHSRNKNTMEVNGAPELFPTFFRITSFVFGRTKTFIRFGTTWGWVNYRMFIFGWTIPLSSAGIFVTIANNTHCVGQNGRFFFYAKYH